MTRDPLAELCQPKVIAEWDQVSGKQIPYYCYCARKRGGRRPVNSDAVRRVRVVVRSRQTLRSSLLRSHRRFVRSRSCDLVLDPRNAAHRWASLFVRTKSAVLRCLSTQGTVDLGAFSAVFCGFTALILSYLGKESEFRRFVVRFASGRRSASVCVMGLNLENRF
ncbi:hypothetical protein L596_028378 [Steinernema carpocapsae]|uniref:Uncharacterized protein n=1 Tax=Steinernema carpocapsae TaxID=34508 RepID=A0A4U5LYD7_STECR|nr:hypothetical protein L596_028378 [Steinernema carpocapsae]